MSHITTHILDSTTGRPAEAVSVELQDASGSSVASGLRDGNGRITELGPERLELGNYRLVFAVGEYFAAADRATLYPQVTIDFTVSEPHQHYHVPLLISPYAYSTYRGN